MFGHNSDDTQPQGVSPAQDNNLNSDQDQAQAQASPMDDTAGDYIATDVPAIPSAPAAPVSNTAGVDAPSQDESDQPAATAPAAPIGNDDLLDLKQQALSQLSPLVGHLDQSPEEKFRTTMMMIQASDNDSLIKTAYEAALQITDEKARAQALLDVVNEINYFTQQHEA
jgi:hypothetical protein